MMVNISFGENAQETAVLLLASAEKLDLDASVVQVSDGEFVVPEEVADDAGFGEEKPKKAAAKKAAAGDKE